MQFGFGLHLHSDIPVPGAVVPDCPIIAPTIRIVRDSFAPGTNDPGFSKIGSAILYQHSDASFLCDAQQISVQTRDDAHIDDVGAQLIANALPALLWLAGSFMLHAACVRLPTGGVVAIAGHSGSGKSRLAGASPPWRNQGPSQRNGKNRTIKRATPNQNAASTINQRSAAA